MLFIAKVGWIHVSRHLRRGAANAAMPRTFLWQIWEHLQKSIGNLPKSCRKPWDMIYVYVYIIHVYVFICAHNIRAPNLETNPLIATFDSRYDSILQWLIRTMIDISLDGTQADFLLAPSTWGLLFYISKSCPFIHRFDTISSSCIMSSNSKRDHSIPTYYNH